jgi:hypothetical protein
VGIEDAISVIVPNDRLHAIAALIGKPTAMIQDMGGDERVSLN